MATEFGKRLKQAREAIGLTQEELAKRAQMAQSTLASAETSGYGSRKTPQLALICGVSANWLATGDGPMHDAKGISPTRTDGTYAAETSNIEYRPPDSRVTLDALLRKVTAIVEPQTLSWESVVAEELPEEFKMVLFDDAMSPEFPVGSLVVFSTQLGEPRAGDAILLCDVSGTAFFRLYQPKRPGQWSAVSINPAYQALNSVEDGLRILAIKVGSWGRRG